MISTGTRNPYKTARDIEDRLSKKYFSPFEIEDKKCFVDTGEHYFIITGLEWDGGAIVVEHADSEQEARANLFEDGDMFYFNEMTDEDIYKAILNEID